MKEKVSKTRHETVEKVIEETVEEVQEKTETEECTFSNLSGQELDEDEVVELVPDPYFNITIDRSGVHSLYNIMASDLSYYSNDIHHRMPVSFSEMREKRNSVVTNTNVKISNELEKYTNLQGDGETIHLSPGEYKTLCDTDDLILQPDDGEVDDDETDENPFKKMSKRFVGKEGYFIWSFGFTSFLLEVVGAHPALMMFCTVMTALLFAHFIGVHTPKEWRRRDFEYR